MDDLGFYSFSTIFQSYKNRCNGTPPTVERNSASMPAGPEPGLLDQEPLTLKCLNIGTPTTINFPFVPNGKLMVLGVPIFEHIIIRL